MPSKYPVLTPERIISIMERHFGFRYVSQKGSHRKYTDGTHTFIIPMHDEIAKGTLKSILAMSGVSLEEFLKFV